MTIEAEDEEVLVVVGKVSRMRVIIGPRIARREDCHSQYEDGEPGRARWADKDLGLK